MDKYWAVVIVAHALYGAFEWTRYRNFLEKGEARVVALLSLLYVVLLLHDDV